ncbi:OCIA domain-containing protein 1 [Anabarilius grahami]|uniref:OCIA domain-containing protein 1 n=1 Tax=Anabarilius grahami TaxID=495550 RepID=A0A3N0YXY3_ANAGA|nr:OCIA domain-containing protein 1 [Anabarilius grahami]
MSQASSGFNQAAQVPHASSKGPFGAAYIPNEEERRVFRECNSESFWYRSLPFSAIAIGITQVMVSRVAGVFGYIGGKMSYMKVCQEKFRKLENSPLGEALRQGRNMPSVSMPESYSSYTSDYTYSSPSQSYDPTPFSSGFSDSGPVNIRDDISPQAPLYPDEDMPKKRPVLYEELRNKNRENYEVTLTQKAETLMKPQREVAAPKEVKKNKYGDAWDE